jgi:Acetyltransferase (GNAT) domain
LVPPDPPLRDDEIVLRPSRESDAPAIRAVYSEPDIRKWMAWDDALPDDAEARANIERAARAWETERGPCFGSPTRHRTR